MVTITKTRRQMLPIKLVLFVLSVALTWSDNSRAADIATDGAAESGAPENSNGGYFEFGVGLHLNANSERPGARAQILLAGAYRYRGLLLEAFTPSISANGSRLEVGGISLGVNLWHNDRWSLDLLGASTQARFRSSRDNVDVLNSTDPELERAVLDRDTFYSGAGIRLTGYFGNTIFRYRLMDDTHGGNGLFSSATIGYSRQLRNWNIHTLLSANFLSEELGQLWYGISADEASERFPQFDIGSTSFTYDIEIGATYPIRENVVFRSVVRHTQLSDTIRESPFLDNDNKFGIGWSTTISYVF